ncbi:TPA: biotin--[acetyl-CoA-carboxylase] ligase [Klebsiella quasipneumoniae subsp. similipneumoniae]|nr:biotin--[acetyl-CoA-carboxylase] ligase [Klebsiella quasipneumoniae subsp. similipneumoniae]
MKIITLKTTDSTNSEAKRRVEKTGETFFAISAGMQTAGRGRFGRTWQTPEGNVAVTIVVPRPKDASDLPSVSLMTGIAIHDALSFFVKNAHIGIKWPNDILINGAKISGTLIEVDSRALYVGIGINRIAAPVDVPYATATLEQFALKESAEVVEVLVKLWCDYFETWKTYGFVSLKNLYTTRMSRLNEHVEIAFDEHKLNKVSGVCRGVDDHGNLLIEKDSGDLTPYNFGEIQYIEFW